MAVTNGPRAHLWPFCAGDQAATFTAHAAMVASHWQNRAWTYRVSPIIRPGLHLFSFRNFHQGLFSGDVLVWYIKKWSYKVKIKRFLNKQKIRKTIYIYLWLTWFLFRNSLTIYSKKSYHHPPECLAGHRFPKFHRSFRLTQFPTSQLVLLLRAGLMAKSSSKITLGLIIGETHKFTVFVWRGILKIGNHQGQKPILFEKCWECPLSSIVLYQSTHGWSV